MFYHTGIYIYIYTRTTFLMDNSVTLLTLVHSPLNLWGVVYSKSGGKGLLHRFIGNTLLLVVLYICIYMTWSHPLFLLYANHKEGWACNESEKYVVHHLNCLISLPFPYSLAARLSKVVFIGTFRYMAHFSTCIILYSVKWSEIFTSKFSAEA